MENAKIYRVAKLICESESNDEIQKTYVRLENVLEKLDNLKGFYANLSGFRDDEIAKFMESLFKLLDTSEEKLSTITTEDRKSPNRMLLHNLGIGKNLKYENVLNHFIRLDEKDKPFQSALHPNNSLNWIRRENMKSLVGLKYVTKNFYQEYFKRFISIKKYFESTKEETMEMNQIGIRNPKIELQVLNLVENSFSNLTLITLNHIITSYQQIESQTVMKYIDQFGEVLNNLFIQFKKETNDYEESLFLAFARYLFFNDRRYELELYDDIFNTLIHQTQGGNLNFGDVPNEYKHGNRNVDEIKIKKNLINIVTEGKGEKYSRFNDKLELTNRLYSANTGLSKNSLLHLKMVYREIFFDSDEFRGKSPLSMIKNMKQVDNSEKFTFECEEDELLFGEKLSRASYREYSLNSEFVAKTELKLIYINLLIAIYQSGSIEQSWDRMEKLISNLGKCFMEILAEIDDVIEDPLLTYHN